LAAGFVAMVAAVTVKRDVEQGAVKAGWVGIAAWRGDAIGQLRRRQSNYARPVELIKLLTHDGEAGAGERFFGNGRRYWGGPGFLWLDGGYARAGGEGDFGLGVGRKRQGAQTEYHSESRKCPHSCQDSVNETAMKDIHEGL
jgi:hypothetical protein